MTQTPEARVPYHSRRRDVTRGLASPLIGRIAIYALSASVLIGCQSAQIHEREDLLAAAGFQMKPANTPERQAALRKLPANKFVPKTKGDQVAYVFADPVVCNCLYVGDQAAYSRYKQEVFQRNLADEQQMTALTYQNAWDWDGWDWGPWGWRGRWW